MNVMYRSVALRTVAALPGFFVVFQRFRRNRTDALALMLFGGLGIYLLRCRCRSKELGPRSAADHAGCADRHRSLGRRSRRAPPAGDRADGQLARGVVRDRSRRRRTGSRSHGAPRRPAAIATRTPGAAIGHDAMVGACERRRARHRRHRTTKFRFELGRSRIRYDVSSSRAIRQPSSATSRRASRCRNVPRPVDDGSGSSRDRDALRGRGGALRDECLRRTSSRPAT